MLDQVHSSASCSGSSGSTQIKHILPLFELRFRNGLECICSWSMLVPWCRGLQGVQEILVCKYLKQVAGSKHEERQYCAGSAGQRIVLQAAVEEGIVPGGGVALLYASKTLEEVKSKNASFDQKIGVDIVMKALQMPLKTIANNAGAPVSLP